VTEARTCNPWIPPLLVAALSLAAATRQAFPLTSLSTLSYDPADADIFLWDFWWTKHALGSGANLYWSDLLLYPNGASLALHSYPLPYSLLSVAFQSLWPGVTGLVIAFNLVVFVSFLLSGLGAYWLAARVTGSRAAALVAGIAFAWMPFRALNVARLHVLGTECLAWLVLGWIAFTDVSSRLRATALGVCFAFAFYTSLEYALYAAVFCALWLAFHWRSRRSLFTRAFWRHLALSTAVFVVLASPLLYAQARGVLRGDVQMSQSFGEVASWDPALLSLVTPSRVHPVYGKLLAAAGEYGSQGVQGMRSETTIPLTLWAFTTVAVWRRKRDGSTFWLVAAGMFLVLTLGPFLRLTGTWNTRIPLPHAVLYWLVPPLRASRDPTRLFPMAVLMLSVVAAFGVRSWLRRIRRPLVATAATALTVSLVLFESMTVWPGKVPASALTPDLYEHIAATPGDFAVLDLNADQLALLAQTVHHKPVTAGRTSVPRSASARRMLSVERDFRWAEAVLALGTDARESRVISDRQELEALGLRFVVLPERRKAQLELATQLGLRPVANTGLMLWEVFRSQ
jgi:hypothetical protein